MWPHAQVASSLAECLSLMRGMGLCHVCLIFDGYESPYFFYNRVTHVFPLSSQDADLQLSVLLRYVGFLAGQW